MFTLTSSSTGISEAASTLAIMGALVNLPGRRAKCAGARKRNRDDRGQTVYGPQGGTEPDIYEEGAGVIIVLTESTMVGTGL